MTDHYISTPNADEFREATTTIDVKAEEGRLTLDIATTVEGRPIPEAAYMAAHSIIDSLSASAVETTTAPILDLSASTVSWREIPVEEEPLTEAEQAYLDLKDDYVGARQEITTLTRALHQVEKDRDAALAKLAERDKDYVAAEIDARDARFTLGALRRTLTAKETEQFEEGLRHLLVAEASERDIEDAERENAHLQGEMAKQRAEYTARYTAANRQIDALLTTIANAGVSTPTLVADVHTQIGIMLEAGKVESDYHRNRNELERNKQTIVRAKQIAGEHALSGRALICAAFARSPELPTKPKLTVDEKFALANLQSMED